MKNNKVVLAILGGVLAALWTGQAVAGLVQLEKIALDPNVLNGGGRTVFEVLDYIGTPGEDPALFTTTGSLIYASCIEPNETISNTTRRTNDSGNITQRGDTKWYKIESLVNAPTSTGSSFGGQTISGFTGDEIDIVERILSNKFDTDLTPPNLTPPTIDDPNAADIAALQALLWHFAVSSGTDAITRYGNTTTRNSAQYTDAVNLAMSWLDDVASWTSNVTTYALLAGNLVNGAWVDANRQDFVAFKKIPQENEIPVPVPAPLLLFATGLLGLYGALRRRRA